jgi:hypothetical protein
MRTTKGMPRWLGAAVLLSLVVHAITKIPEGTLPEMLWFCHAASVCIVLGIFLERALLLAVGLLFHIAMGVPGYVLDVIHTGTTAPTSVLVHILPAAAAIVGLVRLGYPRGAVWGALVLFHLMQPVSYLLTPPALNIDLAFSPWEPLAPYFSNMWTYRLFNAVMAFLFLGAVDLVLRLLFWRRLPWNPPQTI